MSNSRKLVLAVDTGGTTIKYGLYWMSPDGSLVKIKTYQAETARADSQKKAIEKHVEQITALIKWALEYAEQQNVELIVREGCPGQFKKRGEQNVIDLAYFLEIKKLLDIENAVHFPTLYWDRMNKLLGKDAEERLKRVSYSQYDQIANDVDTLGQGIIYSMMDDLPKLKRDETRTTLVMTAGTGVGGLLVKRDADGNLTVLNDGEVGRLMINYGSPEALAAFKEIGFDVTKLEEWSNGFIKRKYDDTEPLQHRIHNDLAGSGRGSKVLSHMPDSADMLEFFKGEEPLKTLMAMGIMQAALIVQMRKGDFLNDAGVMQWTRSRAKPAMEFDDVVLGGAFYASEDGKFVYETMKQYLKDWGYGNIDILLAPNEHSSRFVAEAAAAENRDFKPLVKGDEKILVLGAGGQVGKYLIPELKRLYGDNLILTDAKSDTGIEKLDVTDYDAVEQTIVDRNVKVVIDLAALLSADAEKKPELAHKINVESPLAIMDICEKNGVRQFFFPSSVAVSSKENDGVVADTTLPHELKPVGNYGNAKQVVETYAQWYSNHTNLSARCLRYGGVLACNVPPSNGTTEELDRMIVAAAEFYFLSRERKASSCQYSNSGIYYPQIPMSDEPHKYRFPMIDARSIAQATMDFMHSDSTRIAGFETRTYVAEYSATLSEVADILRKFVPDFKIKNEPSKFDENKMRFGDTWSSFANTGVSHEKWGYKQNYSIEESVEHHFWASVEKIRASRGATVTPAAA